MLFTFRNIDLWLCFFIIIYLLVIINLFCLISSLLVWSIYYAGCIVGYLWLSIARLESFLPCNFGCMRCVAYFWEIINYGSKIFLLAGFSTDHQQHHGNVGTPARAWGCTIPPWMAPWSQTHRTDLGTGHVCLFLCF